MVHRVRSHFEAEIDPGLEVTGPEHRVSERISSVVMGEGAISVHKTAINEATCRNAHCLEDRRTMSQNVSIAIVKVDGDSRRLEFLLVSDGLNDRRRRGDVITF